MRMPGFTAEAALYERSACRYRTGGASTDGAGLLPAMKRDPKILHTQAGVRGLCNACGGLYGPPSKIAGETQTFSCVCPGGYRGIVCGGEGKYADSCDSWGGSWAED